MLPSITQEVTSLLSSVTLNEFLSGRPPGPVFAVSETDSLADVLHALSVRGILSAPLFDTDGCTYLGFVDLLDIASALFEQEPGPLGGPELLRLGDFLRETRVGAISRANDVQNVDVGAHGELPLLEVVKRGFVHPRTKLWCHRLAVFDQEEPAINAMGVEILAVFSQSDAVRFLHTHIASLHTLRATPLAELGFRRKQVFCVGEDTPAKDAFREMLAAGVTAAAVVARGGGGLLGNLSPSDLRGLLPEHLQLLSLPVLEFQRAMARTRTGADRRGGIATEYGVKPADSGSGGGAASWQAA